MNRDQNLALRALIAAVESNNESIKTLGGAIGLLGEKMDRGFEMIETKLDATMGAITDHVNDPSAHGGDS